MRYGHCTLILFCSILSAAAPNSLQGATPRMSPASRILANPPDSTWQEEKQLTDNSCEDRDPCTIFWSGVYPRVVWVSSDSVMGVDYTPGGWEKPVRLSPDTITANRNPLIAEDWYCNVTWQGKRDSAFGIYSYEFWTDSLLRIASSVDTLGHPHSSEYGNHNQAVVWEAWDGNDYEIYFRNAKAGAWDSIVAITDNDYDDRRPSVASFGWRDSLWVVWEGFDGNDYEIMGRFFFSRWWDSPVTSY